MNIDNYMNTPFRFEENSFTDSYFGKFIDNDTNEIISLVFKNPESEYVVFNSDKILFKKFPSKDLAIEFASEELIMEYLP